MQLLNNLSKPRIIFSGDALQGEVTLSISKTLWVSCIFLIAIIGGAFTFSLSSFTLFLTLTAFTLCFGHSLGMHRLFIHKSYKTFKPIEYFFVHLGVLVGLAGPYGMIKTHDLRDWAQHQPNCHDYFGHKKIWYIDAFWQLCCDIKLKHAPSIEIEDIYTNDRMYQWMEKYWMLQQLPWAILFYLAGGISWVIWGIFVRVAVSITGHWLIGYFAHNKGQRNWHVKSASVQGYNVKFCSLITMGESWHNNHHAFPNSAKLGLNQAQADPGWWMLLIMRRYHLVWDIRIPHDLHSQKYITI